MKTDILSIIWSEGKDIMASDPRTELFEPNEKSVNLGIIISTSVSFFLLLFWENHITGGAFRENTTIFFLTHGALYGPAVLQGEWYRLLTYLFLNKNSALKTRTLQLFYRYGAFLFR